LTGELLQNYAPVIESLTLIPSSGRVFKVTIDGELVFDRKALDRHAEPGEIAGILCETTGLIVDDGG